MVFSSIVFLFAYMGLTLLGYYLLPKKFQLYYLTAMNLVFYGWGEPVYLGLMGFSILLNYTSALVIDKFPKIRKLSLIVCIAINLGLLGYYKYTGFFVRTLTPIIPALGALDVSGIVLPSGISLFTFQSMSYVIDVYRGSVAAQKNPVLSGCYVSLFPQLIAGPIVRYSEVEKELISRQYSIEDIDSGLRTFIVGLGKKLLLANPMGQLWSVLSLTPDTNGVLGSWVGILAYTLQIYFDFSGYSDMAIGLGRMMGFHFSENFNYPYIANSITDFWRRWHISLSTWFKEYVYIPLGGNRKGLPRQIVNILVVWFLTGMWHGASWNFIFWGVYFGAILILEKSFLLKALKKSPKWVGHAYALVLIVLGWVLFYFEDSSALFTYAGSLFGIGTQGLISQSALVDTLSYLPMMIIAALAATPLGKNLFAKIPEKPRFALGVVGALLLFALCVGSVTSQSYNPFIYFRF